MRAVLLLIAAIAATPAVAQPRFAQPPAPLQSPLDALRADFAAQSGGTTIYFMSGSAQLMPQATLILARQAAWLRQHPEVGVRLEGHGDGGDTRDHALALGARRAEEVRSYLILLGIPAAQVSAMTWGKERPGPPSVATTIAPDLRGAPLIPAGS